MVADQYKQTEVGVIPSDWEVKRLSDLSSLITKGTTPKRFTDTGVIYVKIESLAGDEINTEKCLFIDDLTHKTDLKRSILNEGDLLFAIAGATIGKCTIVPKEIIPANTNQALAIIRLKEGENKMYVFYFLKSTLMQKYIIDNIAGGAQPNLNLAQIGGYFFPLPPTLAEQTAIATALSDTDALIGSVEKLIAKKRNIKQGVMQQLLSSTGSDGKPKEGWVVKKLGEVLKIKHGKDQKEIQSENGIYPILGTGGLMGFTNEFLYDKPSVLIGRKGTIDKPQFMETPFWTVDTLFYSEILKDYDAKFIFYIFNMIDWYSYNEASGVPSLNAKTIEKIEKGFPFLQEQTRIATILSDMDAEIAALECKLEKYRQVKLGMMQELLTGKIRLNQDLQDLGIN
jgi:type I restriction enzyme S subunit